MQVNPVPYAGTAGCRTQPRCVEVLIAIVRADWRTNTFRVGQFGAQNGYERQRCGKTAEPRVAWSLAPARGW